MKMNNTQYVIIDGRKLTIYPVENDYEENEETLHDHKKLTKLKRNCYNEYKTTKSLSF